jgi:hypothetical protein
LEKFVYFSLEGRAWAISVKQIENYFFLVLSFSTQHLTFLIESQQQTETSAHPEYSPFENEFVPLQQNPQSVSDRFRFVPRRLDLMQTIPKHLLPHTQKANLFIQQLYLLLKILFPL